MQTTWKVTDADRDSEGNIKVGTPAEPRSLADLLPKVEPVKQAVVRARLTRSETATLAAAILIAAFILIYAWQTPGAPTALPTPAATIVPTLAPTERPTAAPTPAQAAMVGYFDYQDTSTATAIEARQIQRVIGRADDWRLVDTGSARVWVEATQVPMGTPQDSPLPDLTPRRPIPAPAPIAQPASVPVACTQDIAPYVVTRQIMNGSLPIGSAMGFSCTSATEAETNAAAHEAEVRASYQATVTTKTAVAGR